MAVGDVTATYEGVFTFGSAALLTELNTLNTGAATAGADTKSVVMVPDGTRDQLVHVYLLSRAAA